MTIFISETSLALPGHLISTRPWISLLQGSDTNPSGDAASQGTFKIMCNHAEIIFIPLGQRVVQ